MNTSFAVDAARLSRPARTIGQDLSDASYRRELGDEGGRARALWRAELKAETTAEHQAVARETRRPARSR
jgi:hypothetical protein